MTIRSTEGVRMLGQRQRVIGRVGTVARAVVSAFVRGPNSSSDPPAELELPDPRLA